MRFEVEAKTAEGCCRAAEPGVSFDG